MRAKPPRFWSRRHRIRVTRPCFFLGYLTTVIRELSLEGLCYTGGVYAVVSHSVLVD